MKFVCLATLCMVAMGCSEEKPASTTNATTTTTAAAKTVAATTASVATSATAAPKAATTLAAKFVGTWNSQLKVNGQLMGGGENSPYDVVTDSKMIRKLGDDVLAEDTYTVVKEEGKTLTVKKGEENLVYVFQDDNTMVQSSELGDLVYTRRK